MMEKIGEFFRQIMLITEKQIILKNIIVLKDIFFRESLKHFYDKK